MSRTVIDLDDEALEAAARELGTVTKQDTVNTALREVAARYRRLRSLDKRHLPGRTRGVRHVTGERLIDLRA